MSNSSPNRTKKQKRGGRWLRWILRLTLTGIALAVLALAFWLRTALYHRWVRFPREAAAWAAIRADRQAVTEKTEWRDFSGVTHSHSELSHDSEVPFPEILRVLKETRRDFICLSDHCDEGKADFDVQWRGLRDGKLFIPGFEMKEGNMPFGAAAGTVLSNQMSGEALARRIAARGGVLFYAHCEQDRAWDRPELTGIEIYNIHADFKDEGGLMWLLPDILVNHARYPDHVMRLLFDRPTPVLNRWDELNRDPARHLTGIGGNDCHQNTGVRILCTTSNTIRIEDTSPETLKEFRPNLVARLVARLLFGKLEPGRMLFHFQLDPYARMVRFVGTHVLARELSELEVLAALRAGRAFVAFDMLADSTGFLWLAENGAGRAVMGESLAFEPGTRLRALSPHRCRFTILKDGQIAHRSEGRAIVWTSPEPGRYRVEAELDILGEWVPWVYANPIALRL